MTPLEERYLSLLAESLRPVPPPPRDNPDGPTARWMRQQQLEAETEDPVDEPHAA